MENKIRVEYLFPNINNKRKYKWLENASFIGYAKDSEIVNFNFEEYMNYNVYMRHRINILRSENGVDEDVTYEENKKDYEKWRKLSHDNIYGLKTSSFLFDNEITYKLALYLEKNPLALPQFIQIHSINIIGLFLGVSSLETNLSLSEFESWRGKFFQNQIKSYKEYEYSNFKAKYQLTLFLSVLDNLMDLGVNLQEYKFTHILEPKENTFNNFDMSSPWNLYLKKYQKEENYIRCDGQEFTKEQISSYIDFHDLNSFLDKVVDLTEVEYYIDFIEDAVTIDPKKIIPIEGMKYGMRMNDFPKENLIDIKTLCKNMQKKLNRVAQETEILIINRKLDEIKNELENQKKNESEEDTLNYEELTSKLREIYDEILKLNSTNKKKILEKLDVLLTEIHKQENDIEKMVDVSGVNLEIKTKDEFEKLDSRMKSLEKRMVTMEQKMDEIKQEIVNFLEHGGENPLTKNTELSREEVIKIISEYNPTTISSKWRKVKVIAALLAAGALGMIAGNNLNENKELVVPSSCQCTENMKEQSESEVPDEPIIEIPETQIPEENILSTEEKAAIYDTYLGIYGNGEERIEKLEEAGYDYNVIQEYVNQLVYGEITMEELNSRQFMKK